MNRDKTVLVTGGAGFLGKKICTQLKERGYKVISLSRKKYPELEVLGIESRVCDIKNFEDVLKKTCGADSLIHTAAKAGIWGNPKEFHETNTLGTKNLLEASKQNKIKYFVHTSSPSVCFDGDDILGSGEEEPYAKKHLCAYSESKEKAERLVLEASKNGDFRASCLRPHLIWGPGDPHFLPRLQKKAAKGKLFQLGNGGNLVDVIYLDNASKAHIDLLEHLFKSDKSNGQAYFIGQERPVDLWPFLNELLLAFDMKPINKRIPFCLAYPASIASHGFYKLFRIYNKEPELTPFLALQLAKSHYFSHKRAKNDFGYSPEISITEGLELLRKSAISRKEG